MDDITMRAMAMPAVAPWSALDFRLMFVMWAVMMVGTRPYVGGALLVAAGVYQWTPLKHACLENCRAPAEYLSRSWRSGTGGAIAMGVHHGANCVGCCWALMGLLFVVGVMNLLWVAANIAFVLIEKFALGGYLFARAAGALFVAAGVYMMIHG